MGLGETGILENRMWGKHYFGNTRFWVNSIWKVGLGEHEIQGKGEFG